MVIQCKMFLKIPWSHDYKQTEWWCGFHGPDAAFYGKTNMLRRIFSQYSYHMNYNCPRLIVEAYIRVICGAITLLKSIGKCFRRLMGYEKFCSANVMFVEYRSDMMTSSNGNTFRVAGLLWGEFPSHRPASDAELLCFPSSSPEPTVNSLRPSDPYMYVRR